jgi:uncharacterized membrane protein YphA (DoxX/SURF4 family)
MPANTASETYTRKTRLLLWTIQGALALLFLFAGFTKLAAPSEALAQQSPLPPLFLKFIGLAELTGALGLVLPGVLRVWRRLTSLAAAGLVIIMVGATATTISAGAIGPAVVPAVVGLLSAFVAYKRWLPFRTRGPVVAPALQAT